MTTLEIILLAVSLLVLVGAVILFVLFASQKRAFAKFLTDSQTHREKLENTLKEFHKENKDDYERAQTSQREEITNSIKTFNDSFNTGVKLFSESQKTQLESLQKVQDERLKSMEKVQQQRLESLEKSQTESLKTLDKTQTEMIKSTDDKLENIRKTVEEKLDKTLTDRLGKSFDSVSKQLEGVQKGLGEMKTLAEDVGGLKKVLSNVKLRGGVGEVQLQMLLEQYLAPNQYEANVKCKPKSENVVEFAIKFPGPDGKNVWLPIDSKFPQDKYEQLINAYETGDKGAIDNARKEFSAAIVFNAKTINEKYINVPLTTRFAIMFLPFEGIYAEAVRDGGLLEKIMNKYNITIAGPTNLAAILTSFQLGFQTLAIQKRGDEVWKILGGVKTEFAKFEGMLQKAKGKFEGGLKDLDTVLTTRTNMVNRSLNKVQALDDDTSSEHILEIADGSEDLNSDAE